MKIGILDQNVARAAITALAIKRGIPQAQVEYYEHERSDGIETAGVILADPDAVSTAAWVAQFRSYHPKTTLVLISDRDDLIAGSMRDACWALSRPFSAVELISVLGVAVSGKTWVGTRTEKYTN
jgi:hypothetical protein